MEKISIRPKSIDITINNDSDGELSEVFSYDYSSVPNNGASLTSSSPKNPEDVSRKLGSLFLVGHIEPKKEENSYIINLVASLAKREYFSDPELEPKEAFSKALKKTNEVLQDFFKDKNTKVDIGIFSIASDNIYISKLGKFKLFMNRGNDNVDVLNNIKLFTKDSKLEQEFSNVISGKVMPGDKLLAFYPSKSISTRERFIKDYLAKNDGEGLISKINAIREKTPTFSMAGIFMDINKVTEPAYSPKVEPEELKTQIITADTSVKAEEYKAKPVVNQTSKSIKITEADKTLKSESISIKDKIDQARNTLVLKGEVPHIQIKQAPQPLIIPSEFSSARRANPVISAIQKTGSLLSQMVYPRNNNRLKIISFSLIVALVIGGSYFARTYIFQSAETKKNNSLLTEIETNMQLANTKIGQNDLAGARESLTASLASILNISQEEMSDKYLDLKAEISSKLDEIDHAVDATVVSVESLPKEINDQNALYKEATDNIKNGKYALPSEPISFNLYEGNMYSLHANGVYKTSDFQKNTSKAEAWLKEGSIFPADPMSIYVDGNVHIVTKSGFLNTYFKGQRQTETKLPINITADTELLGTNEGTSLYLVDKKLARVYEIDKKLGTLVRTLKINSSASILDSSIMQDGSLFITTQDNRFWSVK